MAAAVGDEEGALRGILPVIDDRSAGAVVAVAAAVIVGILEGWGLAGGAQIPGAEGLAGRLVPAGRHIAAGEAGAARDPFWPVIAAGAAGVIPAGRAKAPGGGKGAAIHLANQAARMFAAARATDSIAGGVAGGDAGHSLTPAQQAANRLLIASAAVNFTRGIAGNDVAIDRLAHQAAEIGVGAGITPDGAGGPGGEDGAIMEPAHQTAGIVRSVTPGFHNTRGIRADDDTPMELPHQATDVAPGPVAKDITGRPAGNDGAASLSSHQATQVVSTKVALGRYQVAPEAQVANLCILVNGME